MFYVVLDCIMKKSEHSAWSRLVIEETTNLFCTCKLGVGLLRFKSLVIFSKCNIKTEFSHEFYNYLSYDVTSGSEITPCIKIDKSLVNLLRHKYIVLHVWHLIFQKWSVRNIVTRILVFGERKYIMKIINIEVGNVRGWVEGKWAPGYNSVI